MIHPQQLTISHDALMKAILSGRVEIAKNVNAKLLPLEQAPSGYKDFDRGASVKYILDPNGLAAKMCAQARCGTAENQLGPHCRGLCQQSKIVNVNQLE